MSLKKNSLKAKHAADLAGSGQYGSDAGVELVQYGRESIIFDQ